MEAICTTILVVEDSPEDWEATRRAFRQAGLRNSLVHCADGDQALDYLYQRGVYAEPGTCVRPNVILLDLNLPGTDGREVLAELKADENLRSIPIIVLTSSSDPVDIEGCYRDGANTYIQKPVDLKGFMDAVVRLKDYWLEIAILPRGD